MRFHVSISNQTVSVLDGNLLVWSAPVSTSKFGVGEEAGSHRTPRGLHCICEKIGGGTPRGSVFKGRVFTGQIRSPDAAPSGEDFILTRILWLEGLEPANANTRGRFIYFHGTHEENLIGTPASHGCIRLRNDDIIRLFDYAEIGTEVLIQ